MTYPHDDSYASDSRVIDAPPAPVIVAEAVPEPLSRRVPLLPVLLFLATCWTTTQIGGFWYSASLMFILTAHELGHYIQARRYHVPASLPYFIPIPAPPLGTMGAVIGMRGYMGDRKALFDIGISGPLAGLVPTLFCCIVGLQYSSVVDSPPTGAGMGELGEPLIFQLLAWLTFGPIPEGKTVMLGAMAYAGWVGIFITALNLMPIGQLDGGHVLYAILRRKAHVVASLLLFAAIGAVLWTQSYQWLLMLFLLVLMGPNHAPTANDDLPLGTPRVILGWLTLAFVIIGFTPRPFAM